MARLYLGYFREKKSLLSQLLASEVPVPESGIVAHAVAFPELMEPAMQRAADKAKRKRKDLNLPVSHGGCCSCQ